MRVSIRHTRCLRQVSIRSHNMARASDIQAGTLQAGLLRGHAEQLLAALRRRERRPYSPWVPSILTRGDDTRRPCDCTLSLLHLLRERGVMLRLASSLTIKQRCEQLTAVSCINCRHPIRVWFHQSFPSSQLTWFASSLHRGSRASRS